MYFLIRKKSKNKKSVYGYFLHASLIIIMPMCILFDVSAQEVESFEDDHKNIAKIKNIEDYMNSIKTLKARFLQISSEGEFSEGTFYLKRPGKIRVEYDPPSPILIVGDGFLLHYHDRELGQINDWPIFDTPLGALSDDYIKLNDQLLITSFKYTPGVIKLRLVQRDDPEIGGITLVFTESPLALRQWEVDDSQGLTTQIDLFDISTNLKLDPRLFIFDDPRKETNIR